jgi:hypothetical protein
VSAERPSHQEIDQISAKKQERLDQLGIRTPDDVAVPIRDVPRSRCMRDAAVHILVCYCRKVKFVNLLQPEITYGVNRRFWQVMLWYRKPNFFHTISDYYFFPMTKQ